MSFTGEVQFEEWQFQSPLMPPMVMRQYAELIPNFPERFMAAWETQTQHRQTLERTVVATQSTTQVRGQRYTLMLGIVALVVAGVLGITDHEWAAVAVVSMDFLGLGSVFVFSRIRDARDLQMKAQQVPETSAMPSDRAQLPKGRPTPQRPRQSPKKRKHR